MRSYLLARMLVLLPSVLPLLLMPTARGQHQGLECLEEIEVPRFAVVNAVRTGGNVRALVTVGPSGNIADLKVKGSSWRLEAEVEYHLRHRARYKAGCTGQQVELNFLFRAEGEESYTPIIRTYFRPPSGFIIVTQPPKMTIDSIPVEPTPGKNDPKRKQ